jgi:hypothetical protein
MMPVRCDIWRSRRRARPKMSAEIRDLIRKLC